VKMKKTLMTTVAAAAVVSFAAIAAAQTMQGPSGGSGAKPEGGQVEQKSGTGAGSTGGAMMRQPSSAQSTEKSTKPMSPSAEKSANPSAGKAAQGTEPGAKPNDKMSGDKTDKTSNEKMGQSQKNDAAPQRGAEEDSGKADTNAKSSSRAGSVQLSQDQRSRVGSVIGKSSSARVGANVNFNVSVGTRVPSDVHVVVVPQDVVEIVPQYEGFDYVVVGEQILIIDPNDMEIVAIIDA
jgi:uncharacterized protein DUF1236